MNFTMDQNTSWAITIVAIVLGVVIVKLVKVFHPSPYYEEGEYGPEGTDDPLVQQIIAIEEMTIDNDQKTELVAKLLDGRPRPPGEE